MEDIIINCLEDRFVKDNSVLPYSLDTGESLNEVLTELFHNQGYDDYSFSIVNDTCCATFGEQYGYCAIAWISCGKVKIYDIKWRVV